MFNRRKILQSAAAAAVMAPIAARADTVTMPFANGVRPLITVPGKRPLIGLSVRPPQLETPFAVFNEGLLTPNDAFFVRYHLAGIPTEIDPDTYQVTIKGKVDRPLALTLADLKALPAIELVAVHQCSGNSRALIEPRVAGGQLGNGAMGNARWKGVALKTVLDRCGVQAGAKQVSFNGLDGPVLPETPDFVKALDIDHAQDGEVMLAYEMNGAELPWLNGYPVRLVVPGYYGTYWMKHLSEIEVLDHVFDGFWMKSAYRIPDNACACVEPGKAPAATVPIGRFNIRSFLTSVLDGAHVPASAPTPLRGIAFDGGAGIAGVAVSIDGGPWQTVTLGVSLGKYSFREWRLSVQLLPGEHAIRVRATGATGETQPLEPSWNPSGYMRNVVETTRLVAA